MARCGGWAFDGGLHIGGIGIGLIATARREAAQQRREDTRTDERTSSRS
jgi:hypothetical protein